MTDLKTCPLCGKEPRGTNRAGAFPLAACWNEDCLLDGYAFTAEVWNALPRREDEQKRCAEIVRRHLALGLHQRAAILQEMEDGE
jgi:hypothetical protein